MKKQRPFYFYVGFDENFWRFGQDNPPMISIVHQDMWEGNHQSEDCHIFGKYPELKFGLRGFGETMESVFEGPEGLSAVEIRELLIKRGFQQDPEFDESMRASGWCDSEEDLMRAMDGEP